MSLPCLEIRVWPTPVSSAVEALVPPGVSAQSGPGHPGGHRESHQARWLDTLSQAKAAGPAVHTSVSAESLQKPEMKENNFLTVLFGEESPRRRQETWKKKKREREISCFERRLFLQVPATSRFAPVPAAEPQVSKHTLLSLRRGGKPSKSADLRFTTRSNAEASERSCPAET